MHHQPVAAGRRGRCRHGRGRRVLAAAADGRLVLDLCRAGQPGQVVHHRVRRLVVRAEHPPRPAADLGREGHRGQRIAGHLGGHRGCGGHRRAPGRLADPYRGATGREWTFGPVDHRGQRRHGQLGRRVGARGQSRARVWVDLPEAHPRGVRGHAYLPSGAGVVHRDQVLHPLVRIGAGEGEHPGPVRGVPGHLDPVAQRRMCLAQRAEPRDRPVDRVVRVVLVGRVRAVRAQQVVVEVVGCPRGEHVLPGVPVAARAGEPLLVAGVHHGLPAGEEHQLVGEHVPAQLRNLIPARGGDEVADPPHVVVAEEGGQPAGVGVPGRVQVVGGVDAGQLRRGSGAGGEPGRGRLERKVQRGRQLAGPHVGRGELRVGAEHLAEHEEVRLAVPGGEVLDPPAELWPEVHVHVLDGVDTEAVHAGVRDPVLVDLRHPADHLGALGPQVVQPGEVAVLAVLPDEGGVAAVVVHRRIVQPRGSFHRRVGQAGEDRLVREGGVAHLREGACPVGVVAVLERPAGRVPVRPGRLVYIGTIAAGIVDDVGGVVDDHVEVDLHAAPVCGLDQPDQVRTAAEVRVDLGEVGDPVAVVAGRGVRAAALHRAVLEHRRQPDRGGAQSLDVVELPQQPLEVTTVVEALVRRVVPGGHPVAGQTTPVVAGVAVGEPVREHEVELLGPRPRRRGGLPRASGAAGDGEQAGAEHGGQGEAGGSEHRRPPPAAVLAR